jgi:hypothetical protein
VQGRARERKGLRTTAPQPRVAARNPVWLCAAALACGCVWLCARRQVRASEDLVVLRPTELPAAAFAPAPQVRLSRPPAC